jgi:transposase InsO family protein
VGVAFIDDHRDRFGVEPICRVLSEHGITTWSGTVFTAFVSDAYSRRIVGWRTAPSMPTELPLDALEMALWTRARAGHDVDG